MRISRRRPLFGLLVYVCISLRAFGARVLRVSMGWSAAAGQPTLVGPLTAGLVVCLGMPAATAQVPQPALPVPGLQLPGAQVQGPELEEPEVEDDYHTLYYSAHLATDRRSTQLYDQAELLVEQRRYSEALPLLAELMKAPEDAFYLPPQWQSSVVGIKHKTAELLASLPSEGRAEYELQVGTAGLRELRGAVESSDAAGLARVLREFPVTDAASQAAVVVAIRLSDSGDAAGAAQLVQSVSEWPSNDATVVATRQLQAARLWSAAGDAERVERLAQQIAGQGADVVARLRVDGQPLGPIDEYFDRLVATARLRSGDTNAATYVSTSWLDPPAWPVEGGSVTRMSRVPGGEAHLWPRWSARLVSDAQVLLDLEKRRGELARRRQTWIPASSPIAAGDVVVTRTPDKLIAVDWSTGKRIWETRSQLASDDSNSLTIADSDDSTMVTLDANQQRIWLDAVFGTLSTDGRCVFAIEGLASVGGNANRTQWAAIRVFGNNVESEAAMTNKLAAYEIATEGKLLWQIDGAISGSELSGVAFLGPPVNTPCGLFVLAELNNAVQLLQLDAATGKLIWRQPLVDLEQNMMIDAGRRLAGTSPSYGDGLLVCPTGAGSVVAVDPLARRLVWAFRFPVDEASASNNSSNWNRNFGAYQPKLGGAWCRARAHVADRRVVVASPEADQLYCLDLASGQLQWDRARRQALYVGPVVGTQVLVVSNDQIEAIDLQRGTQSWSSGTLPEGATVGGFGLLSEGAYLLPLVDGRMASVDATSGEVTSMITARETNSLGNLIYHRGAVVSQSIDGLQRFDQAQALRERTRNQLATNPNDTEALRTLAEFSLIEGDIPEAIGRLLQAYEVDRTDPLVRERLTDALLAGLRSDYAAYRQQASVLDELIPSGARHVELLRLHVDGCATQQAADQALDYAWQLFIADGDQLIRDSDEYSVLSERWFNARVVRLWDMASPEARERFGRASQNWLNQIAAGARLEGLGRYYRFCKQLPPSSEVALELAEGLLAAERHREAELILLECERWPLSGAQPQRLTSAWQQLLPTSQTQLPEPAAWPAGRVQVEQQRLDQAPPVATRMNRNNQPQRHRLLSRGDSYRYFGGQQLAIDGSGSELVGWNQRGDVEFRHLIEVEEPTGTETPEALRFGQYCVLNEQSEVVVLDLAARQGAGDEAVLWRSRATENSSRSQYIQRIQNGRIVYVSRDNMTGMLDSRYGKVCAAGPGGIVVCNERQLSCFDVLSGDLLWRRRLESDVQLPPLADREHLYLAGGAWGIVVRLADGEIVGKWIPRETKFVASHGSRYVTVNLRSGRRQLQMVDAATDQVLLQRDYATSVELVRGDRDRLYAVDPTGTLDAVDLAAARLAWSAKIEVEPGLDSASTLTDGVTLFLATNTRTQAQHRAAGRETVGNAPVADGHVYCLDFGSGERRWSRAATVSGVGMLELQPLESPVLVLAAQLTDRSSDNTQWVSLLCLDRASGRSVLRDDRLKPLVGVPPTIRVETGAQPAVLINLHHTLVRLQLTDEPFAPEPVSLAEVEAQAGRKKSGLFNTLGRILGGGIESRPTEADDD